MKFLEFFGRAIEILVGLIGWGCLAWLLVLAAGALHSITVMPLGSSLLTVMIVAAGIAILRCALKEPNHNTAV